MGNEPPQSSGNCRSECTEVQPLPSRKLLFWKKEKLCAKFYSPSKNDFLLGEGRICPSGFRRCGQTSSEFLCVRESVNCPINDFFISVDTEIIPKKVSENPNMFYYVLDLRDGGGRLFFTRDNPDGKLLTEDFEFSFENVCLDKTEKTAEKTLSENMFNQYKYVVFHEKCQDLINNFLYNQQYIKRKAPNHSGRVLEELSLFRKPNQGLLSDSSWLRGGRLGLQHQFALPTLVHHPLLVFGERHLCRVEDVHQNPGSLAFCVIR